MKKIIHTLLAASVLLLVSSCVKERMEGGSFVVGGEARIVLRLHTPGGFSAPKSRSLTFADENTIDNVWVLVFDHNNQLKAIEEGQNVTSTPGSNNPAYSGEGEFSLTLDPSKTSQETYNLVVLANAEEILQGTVGFNAATVSDKNYAGVLAAIYGQITSAMYPSGGLIPMWGESGQLLLEGGVTTKSMSLTRSVARIDVGVGKASKNAEDVWSWDGQDANNTVIPFELKHVYVMRPVNRYAVAPNTSLASGSPTVPTGATSFTVADSETKFAFAATGGFSTRDIYIPEADVRMGTTAAPEDDNHLNRMAIVVGGSYNGNQETFYRLDFNVSGSLVNALRNHLYQFNISKVSGNGFPSVEEAYEGANPIEFTVTVTDWGDNINVPLTNKPERWARSNIVWDEAGRKLTFAATQRDNQTIPASSQGVFFKWGSLVAISPVGETYNPHILFSASDMTYNSWGSIPHVGETDGKFGPIYSRERDSFENYNDGSNILGPGYSSTSDRGDICRYISARGWVEGNWRLPTQQEYDELIAEIGGGEGSVSNGKYPISDPFMVTPNESNSYGSSYNGFWQPEPGRWLGEGATRDGVRGAAAELIPGGSSVYFPAGGFRIFDPNNNQARLSRVGFSSHYWSGSSASGESGQDAYIINVNKDWAVRSIASRDDYALSVRCIRDNATPVQVFYTDYDDGKTIWADGEIYDIKITSNVEWEAYVESGTDVVTEGDAVGSSLLNPTTGFGGWHSSATVTRSGNSWLELSTVDYVNSGRYARGTLVIVFRNKATGVELNRISVAVTDPRLLASGRLAAASDVSGQAGYWATAMGIPSAYNNQLFGQASSAPPYQTNPYTPTELTGCGAYYEGSANDPKSGQGRWCLPTMQELSEIWDRRGELGWFRQTTGISYWSATEMNERQVYNLRIIATGIATIYYSPKDDNYTYYARCVRDI